MTAPSAAPRLTLLSVHAHPDDEASKGAPTVARYHAEGVHTVLVCCTGGEEGDLQNPSLREEGQPFHGLDPAAERALVAQMREGVAATGRDPSDIQVVGNLPAVRGSDGKVDIDRSFDAVPALVAAGVTDIRAGLSAPDDAGAAREYFAEVVGKFRTVVGRAPMTYLTGYRLQLAARHLRTTSSTLAEVAEAVGYGSEAAFSRAFKRQVGVSPSEWRAERSAPR